MIAAFAALLLCQLFGEIFVRALALPLPGPVAGLAILFTALLVRGRGRAPAGSVPAELGQVSDALLRHLALLFIPAAVGVVQYLGLLRAHLGALATVLVVSTTLTLAVTALAFRLAVRLRPPPSAGPADAGASDDSRQAPA